MDNGSQKNLVSMALIKSLDLLVTPNHHPYRLRWLNEGAQSLFVTQQYNITFSIGPYF